MDKFSVLCLAYMIVCLSKDVFSVFTAMMMQASFECCNEKHGVFVNSFCVVKSNQYPFQWVVNDTECSSFEVWNHLSNILLTKFS